MPPRPASIKVRALQWLAQREHSRTELRDKLLRLLARSAPAEALDDPPTGADGSEPADADHPPVRTLARRRAAAAPADAPVEPAVEVETLLQWLEARGYLSQDRFVESRVNARQARYGNLRIERELQQHGVDLDAETRQSLQQNELQRAREVWRKKYGAVADDPAGRLRQMRFLAGRGFSGEVVRRVLRGGDDGAQD